MRVPPGVPPALRMSIRETMGPIALPRKYARRDEVVCTGRGGGGLHPGSDRALRRARVSRRQHVHAARLRVARAGHGVQRRQRRHGVRDVRVRDRQLRRGRVPRGRVRRRPADRAGGVRRRQPALGRRLFRRLPVERGENVSGPLRDAWEWDRDVWTPIDSPTLVPVLDSATQPISGYDELNARLLVIDTTAFHSMVYASALSPRDVCIDSDTDGDELVGCADPDCTLRCVACGDGACGELENRRLCPADCP